jgi:succinyl-CoA synthetase beta subunit
VSPKKREHIVEIKIDQVQNLKLLKNLKTWHKMYLKNHSYLDLSTWIKKMYFIVRIYPFKCEKRCFSPSGLVNPENRL